MPDVGIDLAAAASQPRDATPDVSFVIRATFANDEADARLEATIASLLAQTLSSFEIILSTGKEPPPDWRARSGGLQERASPVRIVVVTDEAGTCPEQAVMTEAKGRYLCFCMPGSRLDKRFAEECGWFLGTRPHLQFCNSLSALHSAPGVSAGYDLAGGMDYLKGFPRGAGAPFVRRDSVVHAIGDGWTFDDDMTLTGLFASIARRGGWGATLRELMVVESPEFDLRPSSLQFLDDFRIEPASAPEPGSYATIATRAVLSSTPNGEANDASLNILVVLSWMTTGGADKFNLDMVELLRAKGHKVTICATLQSDHPWEHHFRAQADNVFVLDRFLRPHDVPRFLAYLIESRQIGSVLISGSQFGYQLLPYLRAMAPAVAFLDLCHVEEPDWQNGGYPRFAIGYRDLLDLNIVSTQHLASWMVDRGADPARIRVLRTGVAEVDEADVARRRAEVRARLAIADDMPVIIFGGRLSSQKRPLLLARILHLVNETGAPFQAFIVGDGELRGDLEAAVAKSGLTRRVTLFGSLGHEAWLELLHASDIFLLPSGYEGISIALLEAMAAGVVPVVSSVGGQAEVVSARSGRLVPSDDGEAEAYRDLICDLLRDAKLRTRMGSAARAAIASSFSKRSTTESLEHYLDEARALATSDPRIAVPESLGIETATTALELMRVGSAFAWLSSTARAADEKADLLVVVNMLLAVRRSRLGRRLAGNAVFRRVVRYIARRFARPS